MFVVAFKVNAWNVSKYEVIFGPHFPVFGLNAGKYGPEITPYLDTFPAVKATTGVINMQVTSLGCILLGTRWQPPTWFAVF